MALTGTLAIYSQELNDWMQPEVAQIRSPEVSSMGLYAAYQQAVALNQKGQKNIVLFPTQRSWPLRVEHFNGHVFTGLVFHPQTGHLLQVRETVGGEFFFDFHYTLHMGRFWAKWICGFFGLWFIVLIVTGFIAHWPFLWSDLFVVRPFASKLRYWLDIHIIGGIIFVPFLAGMAYSGMVFHRHAYFHFPQHNRPGHIFDHGMNHEKKFIPLHGGTLSPEDLFQMYQTAQTLLGRVGFIQFRSQGKLTFVQAIAHRMAITRDSVVFSTTSPTQYTHNRLQDFSQFLPRAIEGAHMGNQLPYPFRAVYFLSAFASSVMMGTGLFYYVYKREKKNNALLKNDLRKQSLLMRWQGGVVVSVVLGLPVACAGLLWIARFLPPTLPLWLPERMTVETLGFFLLWGGVGIYGLVVTFLKGWQKTGRSLAFLLSGLSFGLLPVDLATGYVPLAFWAVDGTACLIGSVSLLIGLSLQTGVPQSKPTSKGSRPPVSGQTVSDQAMSHSSSLVSGE
ncbi:PepSY-associated TM region [Entomobacter blattae]|uniref:PepSY-associated TM region n=2 Tax=Entomobacter blattae TaxID=2762277 RepID=A0A7H1NPP9_9PROT|nr:PepSY-associated TM region [Entomobacter blattae]